MTDNSEVNDKIIRKVKGLLALAEDKSNMEESQSAFLQAQKMMVKYGIDVSEIESTNEIKEVLTKSATDYKKLWWWERTLASIIARNFRCKWYYNSKHIDGSVQIKRKIVFVGHERDVDLATEMYALAHNATEFYAKRFLLQNDIKGDRRTTTKAKNDYIRGFIHGLDQKFEEQITEQEWGLVLVVSEEVKEKEKEITKDGGTLNYKIPDLESHEHFQKGYKEGNAIDYTKSTIGEEIIN